MNSDKNTPASETGDHDEWGDYGRRLEPRHRKLLRNSAILPSVAAERGYRTVGELEARSYNFSRAQSGEGLLIPVWDVQGEPATYQLRRDQPRVLKRGPVKYETPKGSPLVLDVHPNVREKVRDPAVPLWITEGIRKVDAAVSVGLVCVGVLGVYGWRGRNEDGGYTALSDWESVALKGQGYPRAVFLCFDSDVIEKPAVATALRRLSSFLRSRGARVRTVHLASRDDGAKIGLDDYLAAGGTVARLIELASEETRGAESVPRRPRISIDDEDLGKLAPRAWDLLVANNSPPRIFRCGDALVSVESGDEGELSVRPLGIHRVRALLGHHAVWLKTGTREGKVHARFPPMPLVNDILVTPEPPLPVLKRLVHTPIVGPDGSVITREGYDERAQVYLSGCLRIPDVPASPSCEDVAKARGLILNELLGDFPFVGPSDRAAAVALLLLPFVRELVNGPTPLHLIEKPAPGTGAGLLVDCIAIAATGRAADVLTEASNEDEWRKRVTARLREFPSLVLVDNLRGCLDSAALSAALTATSWTDRLLGRTETLRLPVRCAWVATGNNPAVSSEVARRSVPIRMDAKMDRPWQRDADEFRHADLRGWTFASRSALVWAALTMARAWAAAGGPQETVVGLGGFEVWSGVLGGILGVSEVPGFLDNLPDFYDRADVEAESWRAFVDQWWQRYGNGSVGAADLFDVALSTGIELGHGSERSQRTRLGTELRNARDRRYGQLRIEAAGVRRNAQRWRLVRTVPDETPLHQA